jgi:hypothetical protein
MPAFPIESVHVAREALQYAFICFYGFAPATFDSQGDSLFGSLPDQSGLFFFVVYHFLAPNQKFCANSVHILP